MIEDIFIKAIDKWGERHQLEMAQEEATELALAIRKFIRYSNDDSFDKLADEMADVEITTELIKFMYPEIVEKIKERKKFKLNRLSNRINEDNISK